MRKSLLVRVGEEWSMRDSTSPLPLDDAIGWVDLMVALSSWTALLAMEKLQFPLDKVVDPGRKASSIVVVGLGPEMAALCWQ